MSHDVTHTPAEPSPARQFAVEVVRRLRGAGFQAVWAGGCVRDRLLGLEPKDYDVATNAVPEQIRDLFGRRRTLAVGQAFGVIVVLGPRGAGQVDVATFRRDATYSDGRRPDSVTFSSAQEDAKRRDFTINGLFYDPLEDRVLDYVGGQADLQRRVIRAIGNPQERFNEDKLRLLRAVRFAAAFEFAIDPDTRAAIRQQAADIAIVSAERIGAELRRMLLDRHRRRGAELLRETRLLEVILPEFQRLPAEDSPTWWPETLSILDQLAEPSFSVALAAFVRPLVLERGAGLPPASLAATVSQRLKLAVAERKHLDWLLTTEPLIRQARRLPWPRLQRVLVAEGIRDLLGYARAVAAVVDRDTADVDHCQQKLLLPPGELNPPPLITGDDLTTLGLPPGPAYAPILEAVRDAQLERRIHSPQDALALALHLHELRRTEAGLDQSP